MSSDAVGVGSPRQCYDGGHVFHVEGDSPLSMHHRCWKCGVEDWDWRFRVFGFCFYPIAWVIANILIIEEREE